jgi:NADP-dependent 3-hydroxy acid dehydrogenase YdfG
VYVATKSAIQGLAESLRKEVNGDGIKISLVEPGAVGSDMQETTSEEERQKQQTGEMLRAEDIAVCVHYILTQPLRCDVVSVQIRPHLQLI